jgi:hypothetical protein
MTDGSVRLPIGILEGITIQVGKFFIPIDFVVCDMKEYPYIPIILGRPFLITAGAKIDVKCGKFSLNFGKEKVEFSAIKINDKTLYNDSCCRVEVFNLLTREKHNEIMKEESRKIVINHDDSVSTGRAKDKGFQTSYKILQMKCETEWLSALKVEKKWVCCGRKRLSEERLSYSLSKPQPPPIRSAFI